MNENVSVSYKVISKMRPPRQSDIKSKPNLSKSSRGATITCESDQTFQLYDSDSSFIATLSQRDDKTIALKSGSFQETALVGSDLFDEPNPILQRIEVEPWDVANPLRL